MLSTIDAIEGGRNLLLFLLAVAMPAYKDLMDEDGQAGWLDCLKASVLSKELRGIMRRKDLLEWIRGGGQNLQAPL